MSPRLARKAPLFICAAVLLAVAGLRFSSRWAARQRIEPTDPSKAPLRLMLVEALATFERLEWITYDARVRFAAGLKPEVSPRLGLVEVTENCLDVLGGWPLSRSHHARVLDELRAQGAVAVGFDMLFTSVETNAPAALGAPDDGLVIDADAAFAAALRRHPRTVLAALQPWEREPLQRPHPYFASNAIVGHATFKREIDSVVRHVEPFVDDPDPNDPQPHRVWHLALELAAPAIEVDLTKTVVERGRLILRDGAGRPIREVPLGPDGLLPVEWSIPYTSEDLLVEPYSKVHQQAVERQQGRPAEPEWSGRIVLVASTETGNNLSDIGATALETVTPLSSTIWNLANSLVLGRFVRFPGPGVEMFLLAILTLLPAVLSWRLRAWWATAAVLGFAAAYVGAAVLAYVRHRWVLPIVLPVGGCLAMTHVAVVAWKGINEWIASSETRTFWRRLLSDNIFTQWEKQLYQRTGGAHRRVTVVFADIRGFTNLADQGQAAISRLLKDEALTPEAALELSRREADETLATVNRYLTEIARIFKNHDGTFDKYIGDCVMAFWGAPLPNLAHGFAAVEAAIEAQRCVARLNRERELENLEREIRNRERSLDTPPQRILPLLSFGIGIHSGDVTVGTLGGGDAVSNYTVFGCHVNIASRLEDAAAGRQILISAATRAEVAEYAPQLAARCRSLGLRTLRGVSEPQEVFEVPWLDEEQEPAAPESPAGPGDI